MKTELHLVLELELELVGSGLKTQHFRLLGSIKKKDKEVVK